MLRQRRRTLFSTFRGSFRYLSGFLRRDNTRCPICRRRFGRAAPDPAPRWCPYPTRSAAASAARATKTASEEETSARAAAARYMATTTAANMDAASAASASASASAATTTTTSAATATAPAAATTTAPTGELQVLRERGWCDIFLVVDVERSQTDVENFLVAEKEFMTLTL